MSGISLDPCIKALKFEFVLNEIMFIMPDINLLMIHYLNCALRNIPNCICILCDLLPQRYAVYILYIHKSIEYYNHNKINVTISYIHTNVRSNAYY